MFKFKNLAEIKTTIAGVIAAILFIASMFWPDKVQNVSGEEVTNYINAILEGLAGLIAVITLIFGSKDG